MSAVTGPAGCPAWCIGHAIDHDVDSSTQVTHQRPVVASDEVHADIEWYEDLRHSNDPDRFDEPPTLVLNNELCLPITPHTVDQLSRALDAARLVLLEGNATPEPESAEALVRRLQQPGEVERLTPHVQACVRAEVAHRRLTAHDVAWQLGLAPEWVAEQLRAERIDLGSLMLLCIGIDVDVRTLVAAAERRWRRTQLLVVDGGDE